MGERIFVNLLSAISKRLVWYVYRQKFKKQFYQEALFIAKEILFIKIPSQL